MHTLLLTPKMIVELRAMHLPVALLQQSWTDGLIHSSRLYHPFVPLDTDYALHGLPRSIYKQLTGCSAEPHRV